MALARLKKAARWEAKIACLEARIPKLAGAHVRVTFHWPDRRRRDRDNAISAFKAAGDGIADAIGVDDSRWQTVFAFGNPIKGGRVVVEITPVDSVEESLRLELERWPDGPASGFEKTTDVAKRIVASKC